MAAGVEGDRHLVAGVARGSAAGRDSPATQRTPTNAGGKSAAPTLTPPPPPDKPANDIAGRHPRLPLQRADRQAGRPVGAALRRAPGQHGLGQGAPRRRRRRQPARAPADGTTPLLMAIINGHYDLAMFLLEHGADPNLASEAGASPLYATINIEWAPKSFYPQPRAQLQQRTTYLDADAGAARQGCRPERAPEEEDLVHPVQLRSPAHRRGRRDAVLARRLRQRHRGDEAADRARRRSARSPPSRGRRRTGSSKVARNAGNPNQLPPMPTGSPGIGAAARRGRRRLRRRLRRQRAPLCRHRHDVGREVPHRRGPRRCERAWTTTATRPCTTRRRAATTR